MSQVPLISGAAYFRGRLSPDLICQLEAQFHADRANRAAGHPPQIGPVVRQDDPTRRDAYKWYTEAAATRAQSWRNEMTLRGIEYISGYEPGTYTSLISSAPLLLIVAENDILPLDIARSAYQRANEPKQPIILPCGHFDVYTDMFDRSAPPARDWFCGHLR